MSATMTAAVKKASLLALPLLLAGRQGTAAPDDRPNVIFILADDLGYGDVGCYGQKLIETPNIDMLAAHGIRFVQHYAGAPVSAPSRASLYTGLHGGHAPIRGNDELAARGDIWNHRAMLDDPGLEGQKPMPGTTRTLGHLFRDAGYRTAIIGKWGLGYPGSCSTPLKMGFDFFYGYNCQREAHTYYPMFLYRNDAREYLDNAPLLTPKDTLDSPAQRYDEAAYRKFRRREYSGDLMFREVTRFVDENARNPFFLLWATPLPHVSLQAPDRWVKHYVDKWGDEEPHTAKPYLPCRYPRATYAAMISYLDEQIGQLIGQLKQKGIYDNTIVVFTSDNGPYFLGGVDYAYFNSAGEFNAGKGWGKASVHEGGIRVPMIFSWPREIKEYRISSHLCAFWDFMPTFAQLLGVALSGPTDGIGFADELYGRPQQEHPFLYWEYEDGSGQRSVRSGKWKLIVDGYKKSAPAVRLYNIETDPREQIDLSASYPEIVNRLEQILIAEHSDCTNHCK